MAERHRQHPVVWGCSTHRTPAGEACQGCLAQGELFPPEEIPRQVHRPRIPPEQRQS